MTFLADVKPFHLVIRDLKDVRESEVHVSVQCVQLQITKAHFVVTVKIRVYFSHKSRSLDKGGCFYFNISFLPGLIICNILELSFVIVG